MAPAFSHRAVVILWLAGIAALAVILIQPNLVDAKSSYTAATGEDCIVCHVNPWGDYPLNDTGIAFAGIPNHSRNPAAAWATLIALTVIPTTVPTAVPTQVPTAMPTQVPTAVPTEVPTAEPTQVPTAVPTQVPTAVPTQVPTAVPTQVPTPAPTAVPPSTPGGGDRDDEDDDGEDDDDDDDDDHDGPKRDQRDRDNGKKSDRRGHRD